MKHWKIVVLTLILVLVAPMLLAQEELALIDGQRNPHWRGVRWGVLAAAFVLGVSAAAGAIGQSRAIAAACDGIARNPGAAGAIRLAMIIGLALIESLVIYALIIAFLSYQL